MSNGFPTSCKSCGDKIFMAKNGSIWTPLSIPISPGDKWRKHGIDCKMTNDTSISKMKWYVPLEGKEPGGWPNGFELDGESVKDPGTWRGANIEQLTRYGIEYFLSNFDEYTGNNWNFNSWLAEINKRFIESCNSETLDGKGKSRLLADRMFEVLKNTDLEEGIKQTNKTFSAAKDYIDSLADGKGKSRLLADRMFEVLKNTDLEDDIRFQMLFAFYPDFVFEEMSDKISPKREFYDEIIYWAEQYDGEGLIGIYADVICSMEDGDWKTASDLIIEEINSYDDAFTVNMLMNILCHTFMFFALQWEKTGVSPEYGLDSIDNIRSIVNTKLEWTL